MVRDMIIKCKSSGAYLCTINIEEYYNSLKKIGVDITLPLRLEFNCRKCKMVETYDVYPTHYEHISSHQRNIDKNKKIV